MPSVPFPSPSEQPNFLTVPNLSAPLINPESGTVGIPWYQFFNFLATRASYVTPLSQDSMQLQQSVSTLQGQVTTLQNEVTTLQGQVTTLQGQVATLQGQVATLQDQVATLQSQVATLQGQVVVLQGQVAHLLTKTNDAGSHSGTDQIVTTVGMAGIAATFTPTINSRGLFLFGTNVQMSTGGGTATIAVRLGTGTPPVLGAALAGTVVSSNSIIAINEFSDITLSGLLSGLTLGTTYWLDIGVSAISGGNLSLNNNSVQVVGLIDPN
jgi:chaperonin cofactor prefoldin